MLELSSKIFIHKMVFLWYTIIKGVDLRGGWYKMLYKDELQINKNEALDSLNKLESELGHSLLHKNEKSISKELKGAYVDFESEITSLQELKEKITTLDTERSTIKDDIVALQEKQALIKKDFTSLYLDFGKALFENYTPVFSDAFGSVYTKVCVELNKIEETRAKENTYREEAENVGFFGRVIGQAKASVSKNQVAMHEQKRDILLSQGAKKVLESENAEKLIMVEDVNEDVKSIFEEYNDSYTKYNENVATLEKLALNEHAVQTELEKAGASISVQRRLSAIDNLIQQKHSEQDAFCANVGYDFSSKYISADGEILITFPKASEQLLSSIQSKKHEVISLTRSIEMENIKSLMEKNKKETEALNKTKKSNSEKIEKLQDENAELDGKLKEKGKDLNDLEERLAVLEKEAQV